MIYLIQTTYYNKETKEIIDLLKIGYTKDLDKRFNAYLLHNPECKLLDKREGDIDLENYFHKYYSKYKYPNREEWFYYNQEIVDNFQSLQIIKGKLLSKEEYIEGLKKHLKSLVSTVNQLKSKYLSDILKESKEKYPEEFDKNRNLIINRIIEIWEYYHNKEISLIESFDYTLLESELTFTSNNMINLDENPWKNSATFYYRTTCDYRKINPEEFKAIIDKKDKKTESLLSVYKKGNNTEKYNLAETYQDLAKLLNYKNDYIGVDIIINTITGDKILKPAINELVRVNEIRAFKIQQIDYKDRFTIFNTISNTAQFGNELINKHVSNLISIYDTLKTPYDRIRLVIDYYFSGDQDKKSAVDIFINQLSDTDYVKMYYTNLGPDRIKSLGCNISLLKKELGIVMFDENKLSSEVYNNFKEGNKISMSNIKKVLSMIYSNIGYDKTPKATDLEGFFKIKKCKISVEDGKRENGYELIKRLY